MFITKNTTDLSNKPKNLPKISPRSTQIPPKKLFIETFVYTLYSASQINNSTHFRQDLYDDHFIISSRSHHSKVRSIKPLLYPEALVTIMHLAIGLPSAAAIFALQLTARVTCDAVLFAIVDRVAGVGVASIDAHVVSLWLAEFRGSFRVARHHLWLTWERRFIMILRMRFWCERELAIDCLQVFF